MLITFVTSSTVQKPNEANPSSPQKRQIRRYASLLAASLMFPGLDPNPELTYD